MATAVSTTTGVEYRMSTGSSIRSMAFRFQNQKGRGRRHSNRQLRLLLTRFFLRACVGVLGVGAAIGRGEPRMVIDHNDNRHATSSFTFNTVPAPAPARVGNHSPARFILLDGELDPNGGGLEALSDGLLPQDQDAPAENFFFRAGSAGGRLLVDLGERADVAQVNSYSWHPGNRSPQVYSLYAQDSPKDNSTEALKKGIDPSTVGWKLLAKVDTRNNGAEAGGQFGVHLYDTSGSLGTFRYLLFDISPTETADPFGHTFYSEIDVVDSAGTRINFVPVAQGCREELTAGEGQYRVLIDSCETPDLTEWSKSALFPVVREWYPKLVSLLPSPGFAAPTNLVIRFSARLKGVAETSGTRVSCAASWFRANLQGEALGSVVHELVHVVQQYGSASRRADSVPRPGWLVEGIADYLRWFLYEPQSHGADLLWLQHQRNPRLRYDAGYRLSANFLNWVALKYDPEVIAQLNAALREGAYREELWKRRTGHTLQELGDEWKRNLEAELVPKAVEHGSP